MKKIIFLLMWVLLIQNPLTVEARKIRVVTTTEDLAAITRAVGGDRVQVDFIARGAQDAHFIDAKPSHILKLSRADLFVQIGLGLEVGWAPSLLMGARNAKVQRGGQGYVNASEGISLLDIPTGRIDRSAGDVHGEGNPHYWLDPMNGRQIAHNIASGLMKIDPEGKERYEQNLKQFSEKLDLAITGWREKMKPFKGVKVVTYHNSWVYFLKHFSLEAVAYIEPKPGIPPSTAHLAQLIQGIRDEQVKIIIVEPYYDGKVSRFVARKSGVKVILLPPSVSIASGISDYFELFEHLIFTLTEALKKQER